MGPGTDGPAKVVENGSMVDPAGSHDGPDVLPEGPTFGAACSLGGSPVHDDKPEGLFGRVVGGADFRLLIAGPARGIYRRRQVDQLSPFQLAQEIPAGDLAKGAVGLTPLLEPAQAP